VQGIFAKWKDDLSQFIVNPVAQQNKCRISFISIQSCSVPLESRRMSSINRRCRILMVLDMFIPEILPSDWADLSSRLKASIAKVKSRGERGQPCLRPLPMRKKVEASSLTKMARFELVIQLIIHFIVC
jgi:hypothetical protein